MIPVVRRIHFEYLGDVMVDVVHTDVQNPVFQAMARQLLTPLLLAAELGRLSDERATAALARVYSEAVIVGSPSPGLCDHSPAEWETWLLEHPTEFATIRSIAEVAENFRDEDVVDGASGGF